MVGLYLLYALFSGQRKDQKHFYSERGERLVFE